MCRVVLLLRSFYPTCCCCLLERCFKKEKKKEKSTWGWIWLIKPVCLWWSEPALDAAAEWANRRGCRFLLRDGKRKHTQRRVRPRSEPTSAYPYSSHWWEQQHSPSPHWAAHKTRLGGKHWKGKKQRKRCKFSPVCFPVFGVINAVWTWDLRDAEGSWSCRLTLRLGSGWRMQSWEGLKCCSLLTSVNRCRSWNSVTAEKFFYHMLHVFRPIFYSKQGTFDFKTIYLLPITDNFS